LSDRGGKVSQDQIQSPQRQVHLIFAMSLATTAAVVTTVIGYRIGSLISICLTAAALGFAGQLLKINADTTIQRTIDDAHRGRVFSIFDMMINVALVLGISSYALISALRNNINLGATQSVFLLIVSAMLSLLLLSDYKKSARAVSEI
jgi:MFS family permease